MMAVCSKLMGKQHEKEKRVRKRKKKKKKQTTLG